MNLPKLLVFTLSVLLLSACGSGKQPEAQPDIMPTYTDELHQRHRTLWFLWTEQYAELESALAQAQAENKEKTLTSNRLYGRFWQLKHADPSFEAKFDAWVAYQQSAVAYLARGLFKLQQADTLRGDKPIRLVSSATVEKAKALSRSGVDDLHQALKKDPRCAMCLGGEIDANLLFGKRDPSLIDAALALDPTLFQPVANHFVSLYPQWGGSEPEMQAFIDKMGTAEATKHLVPHLQAIFYFRRGLIEQYDNKNYEAAIKQYETALEYYPDSDALKNLAELQMKLGSPQKAAATLLRNLEDDPWDMYTLEALAQAYFAQGDKENGERMIKKRDELLMRFRNGV